VRADRKKPAPIHEGDVLEASVETFTLGPDAVARARGFVLFVPGAIPGERVRVRVTEVSRRFGRGEIVDVLSPAPSRVEPFCPVYLACGGCHLQHVADDARREVKRSNLARALEHALGRSVPVGPVASEPSPRAYREKVALTLEHGPRGLRGGFYRARSRDLVAIEGCPVQNEPATRLALALVGALNAAGAGPEMRAVVVRAGAGTGELHAVVVARHDRLPWLERFVALARPLGATGLALNVSPERERDIVLGPETRVLEGPPRYRTRVAGIEYLVSPTSFFQTNAHAAEAIVANVLRMLGSPSGKRVLDVYGGVGLLALQVAKRGGHALVVEGNPASIADGRASAEAAKLQVSFRRGRAEDLVPRLARERSRFDHVILDPPREGCHPRVLEAVRAFAPKKIVYVSCDPESLGRDLANLHGYGVTEVVPIDMFPHAYHVEAVAALEPSPGH